MFSSCMDIVCDEKRYGLIKYLKTFGFDISNETFASNSWYFRNALVRSNYNNWQNGIYETTKFLDLFLENLLMNKQNRLRNRYLHVDFHDENVIQSARKRDSKCQNGTLNLSLEEFSILKIIQKEPTITQKQIAQLSGKSERTVKRRTVEMQEKGYICRESGKRNGKWTILIEF